MRALSTAVALIALASLFGCPDEPPPPTGNLGRPSGLVYVPRDGQSRADVLIADSELEGVLVLQLQGADDHNYVRAPALFFPLVIPAPGFPNALAASADGARLYALSPASNQLHVLDIRVSEFGASATESAGYVPIGTLSLDSGALPALVPPLPDGATAADIALIDAGGKDVVLIAFDLGASPNALLASFVIERPGDAVSVGATDSATIAAGPRRIAVRTEAPAGVLVSSARASSISFVELGPGATSGSGEMLGATRALDAGGPTSAVIDAASAGAVALRLDQNAAIVFDVEGGQLVRSPRLMPSPYDPPAASGAGGASGRVNLFPSPPVTGAHGTVSFLQDLSRTDAVVSALTAADVQAGGHVVAIAHADARISFLIGKPLRPAVTSSSAVVHAIALGPRGAAPLSIAGCKISAPPADVCAEPAIARAEAVCDETVVPAGALAGLPLPGTLRASFRGALSITRAGTLTASAATGVVTLTVAGEPFEERQIRPGDRALIEVKVPAACGAPRESEVARTASVTAIAAGALTLSLDAADPIARTASCAGGLTAAEVEVYPGSADAVLAVIGPDGRVERVLQRVPTATAAAGAQAAFTAPLRLTLTSSTGFLCSEAAERRCGPACDPAAPTCLVSGQTRSCTGVELSVGVTGAVVLDPSGETFQPAIPEDMVFAPLRQGWITSFPGSRSLIEVQSTAQGFRIGPLR